uniref:RNA transcription, translation and transport factor protein n=1 Tax=Scleropages formosus TaxID=113540 RepID=A0A8C9W1G5_SCLFO
MFRRKLAALDYHNPSGFNCKDDTEFRNFVVWLEDQKIRHYKIEDRGNLRNIHSSEWPKFFEKVSTTRLQLASHARLLCAQIFSAFSSTAVSSLISSLT